MALSTIESVASFSVVLAETFAAVGLSTLMPASFLALARAGTAGLTALSGNKLLPANVTSMVTAAAGSLDTIDLLVPKSAKIHAEFEFQGSDQYSVNASVGAMVEVVTIKAGFSYLYSSSSKNKVTLDVDFVSVNYALTRPPAPTPP